MLFTIAGARVSTKCRDPKPTKLVIGPPTSSASLLAFAPPLTSYCQSLQAPAYSGAGEIKDSAASDSGAPPRTSACDPLLSSSVSPYATADLLDTKPSPTPPPPAPPPPQPADLSAFEFPRKNLKFVEMLGEGQFGEVAIIAILTTRSFHSVHNVVDRCVLQAMWEGKVGRRDQLNSSLQTLYITNRTLRCNV